MLWFLPLWAGFFTAEPEIPHPPPPVAIVQCHRNCESSASGRQFIMTWEGYSPVPYKDIVGIETVGYGHVVRHGEEIVYPLIPSEADKLLAKDLERYFRAINRLVKVGLYQNQADAVASFTFNLGEGALGSSTLLKRVNADRHIDVPPEFMKWNKARVGGVLQPVKGLTKRRAGEAELYKKTPSPLQ